jgi:tetratricopeptide (TPR) repeat protein
MRRTTALAALLLALAAAPAARAEQDESGSNFAVPTGTAQEIGDRYAAAVEAFRDARKAEQDVDKKIADAVKKFVSLRQDAPRFAPPCYFLGILYQETKEFEKARQLLDSAVQLNPSFYQAWVELGDVHGWMKSREKALAAYEKAIEVAPRYGHAYAMRGFAKLRAGDSKGALEDFERAEKLGPKDRYVASWKEHAQRDVDGPSWKGEVFKKETEHYVVLTPVSAALAEEVSKQAELIHQTYETIFPKIEKEKRKFTVLVYASKEEYHANGGPAMADGHYDTLLRKLHIYKHPKDEDTHLVMYHEGFHQFIADYLDDPPQWWNEGLGDFFGPTAYEPVLDKKGKTLKNNMRLRPNPWRLRFIQDCIQRGRIRDWKTLMLMSQRQLYEPEWAHEHYAESWSIIYFLVRGGAPPDKPAGPYFKLLQAYFEALRKGAGQEGAWEKAFGKQDVPALEKAWKEFTLKLGPEG